MSSTTHAETTASGQEEEITIFNYARMIWRQKWLVLTFSLLGLGVGYAVTQWMTKIYVSTATLISPKEGGSGLLAGLAVSPALQQVAGLAMPSLTPNRDLLVSVLKSRRVARMVVDRFGLRERYELRYPEDAVGELRERRSSIEPALRESTVSVTVEDPDPALAAEMANYFVAQADRLLSEFDTGGAGRERSFLAAQLARARVDLAQAESAVQRFQEKNRAVVLQEQAKGAILAAAQLKAEVMAAEVQLQVMRSFATEANPEVMALRRRIQEMNRQLAEMEHGDGGVRRVADGGPRSDFSLPLARMPEVGLELIRLTREVTIQDTLVGLLTQQLERTKIAEAHDVPSVTVLDVAAPARRPARPKFWLTLALGVVTGFMIGAGWAFVAEYLLPPRRRRAA